MEASLALAAFGMALSTVACTTKVPTTALIDQARYGEACAQHDDGDADDAPLVAWLARADLRLSLRVVTKEELRKEVGLPERYWHLPDHEDSVLPRDPILHVRVELGQAPGPMNVGIGSIFTKSRLHRDLNEKGLEYLVAGLVPSLRVVPTNSGPTGAGELVAEGALRVLTLGSSGVDAFKTPPEESEESEESKRAAKLEEEARQRMTALLEDRTPLVVQPGGSAERYLPLESEPNRAEWEVGPGMDLVVQFAAFDVPGQAQRCEMSMLARVDFHDASDVATVVDSYFGADGRSLADMELRSAFGDGPLRVGTERVQ